LIAAFDLDGTLVDTYDAVLAAYRSVGVEPPPGWWGKPWKQWLDSEAAHSAKNEVYPAHLHMARPLPPLSLLKLHGRAGDKVWILTGASLQATLAVGKKFLPAIGPAYRTDLSAEDKRRLLGLLIKEDEVIYYDDDLDFLAYVKSAFWLQRIQLVHVDKDKMQWLSR
jgi:hypothetical protein